MPLTPSSRPLRASSYLIDTEHTKVDQFQYGARGHGGCAAFGVKCHPS